jgi:GNAT superfamily N-acetyltransferase
LRYVYGIMNIPLESPKILPVWAEDKRRALEMVFGYLPPADREEQVESALFTPVSGGTNHGGLLGAYRGNRLCGAIFANIMPGKTAQVWLPRLENDEPSATALELLQAIDVWLEEQCVELAQAIFERVSEAEERLLLQAGYVYLSDLLYLASPAEQFPENLPASQLEFTPYDPSRHEKLKSVIEATYLQTLDCPKLNDLRDMEEVVEGYRTSGVFLAKLWSLVRHEGKDIGCLLLVDHPEYDNVELVYMGVVPTARGRGRGMEIARFAQWQTKRQARARIVVAVDAMNEPAVRMYSAVGFQAWDRRRVYFRSFKK